MKDYYQILRLHRTASAHEIRAAYRKLVQHYHPDVNPDPQANEWMKEINEAYEVLGDVNKKAGYDFIWNNPQTLVAEESPPPTQAHRDPAYKRRNTHPPIQQESDQVILMRSVLPYFVKVAWAGCFLCFVLFIDFIWPRQVTVAEVHSFRHEQVGRTTTTYLVTNKSEWLKISAQDWKAVSPGQHVEIMHSGLFSILIAIRVKEIDLNITNLGTIYQNYVFVPLLLLVLSTLSVISKGAVEFRFNLALVNVFIFIFTLITLLA